MEAITNDDLFEELSKRYLHIRNLRKRGAVLDGCRPIDAEYTKARHAAIFYRHSLPESQQVIAANFVGLIAKIHKNEKI